ncbi:ribonuclease 1 [Quercus suber]|uniref:Ribonuclease 1 n=1 Tax=Quercus suber TaxID=58331 RepID=A0AAW0IGF1_QUESU
MSGRHVTCSESILNQHEYFQVALNLKDKVDLLQILESARIHPDGSSYSLSSISDAVKGAIGYALGIECNVDALGKSQFYQIYLCVDTSGSNLIKCPVLPKEGCAKFIFELMIRG